MKTIFISIYDGDTEKNVLRSGTFDHLKRAGHRIVLLIRGKDRLQYYREHFGDERVIIEQLPRASSRMETYWYYIGWNTLPTNSVYGRQRMNRARGAPLSRLVFGTTLWLLGHLRLWRELLRALYAIAPDRYAMDLFEKYQPDLVFAPNMFSPEDFRLMRAAKRRAIPTVTTAKSWDVLTTKAFTRVRADRLIVFNGFNRDEAVRFGDYDAKRVVVTGFPQFDIYTRDEIFVSRDAFCRAIGADPEKRLIMFAPPGDWLSEYSIDILTALDRSIGAGEFSQPLQILARFHPKYVDRAERATLPHVIKDRPGTHLSEQRDFSMDIGQGGIFSWTFTDKDIVHLANSLKHCDIIINTASTLTLDATANDRPVILIGYDGNETPRYWGQIARVYNREHVQTVLSTNAAPVVWSHRELVEAINMFLENPRHGEREREVFKAKLLYKVDGKAAERTAHAVLEMLP